MTILRAVFANKDPLLAYHLIKEEIPYTTLVEFVEYLDVYEAIKEQQHKEAEEKMKQAQQKNKGR